MGESNESEKANKIFERTYENPLAAHLLAPRSVT